MVNVTAEWAIWRRNERPPRAHCSLGRIPEKDFIRAMTRFTPGGTGQSSALPRLTVSWAGANENAHVALTIEDIGSGEHRYFCVPYADLAEWPVGYTGLYRVFSEIEPPADRGVITTDVPPLLPRTIAGRSNEQAMTAAALLLTGARVAILGADAVHFQDRLDFIDTVAALLPYGFRCRFTASTWADGSASTEIRLFFAASAPSEARVVRWRERPPRPDDRLARRYLEELEGHPDRVQLIQRLASETGQTQRPFGEGAERAASILEELSTPSVRSLLRRLISTFEGADLDRGRVATIVKQLEVSATFGGCQERADRRSAVVESGLLRKQPAAAAELMPHIYHALLALGHGVPFGAGLAREVLVDLRGEAPTAALIEILWAESRDPVDRLALVAAVGPEPANGLLARMGTQELIVGLASASIDYETAQRMLDELFTRSEKAGLDSVLEEHGYLVRTITRINSGDLKAQYLAYYGLLSATHSLPLDTAFVDRLFARVALPPPPLVVAVTQFTDASVARYLTDLWALARMRVDGTPSELIDVLGTVLESADSNSGSRPFRFRRS